MKNFYNEKKSIGLDDIWFLTVGYKTVACKKYFPFLYFIHVCAFYKSPFLIVALSGW